MQMAGEGQLQRIIRDLHDAVTELSKDYKENGDPVTDDCTSLHKLSYKLEYLLQFDQKEKTTFLGTRKDYWEYFNDCLAKIKGANDGIRFVKSISELKTSLGKGRAFIRYSLVHQRLADTLQQCLINQKVTSDWYYSRSPFLQSHLSGEIINYLYELNEVQFDVASRGHDLDSAWPTFARRTLGMTNSPSHMWRPPSRSSSISSLASSYSQQAPEFPCSLEIGPSLLNELSEPLVDSTLSTVDELRLELDQSELEQRELVEQIQQLVGEATELRDVVTELQRQLDISLATQANHQELQLKVQVLSEKEQALVRELEVLRGRESVKQALNLELQDKLAAADRRIEELMAKLDGVLEEKGQKAASHFDSAQKIHELLDGLKEAEKGRIEALADGEEKRRQTDRLAEELSIKEQALRDGETKMADLTEKCEKLRKQAEDQRNAMGKLQEELSVREKEVSSLQKDLQDLQRCLQTMEIQAADEKKRTLEERDNLQKKLSSLKESLEEQVEVLKSQLSTKETELLFNTKTIQQLDFKANTLTGEKQSLSASLIELETKIKDQTKKFNEYEKQCCSLMEQNNKLLHTAKMDEETMKDLVENKSVLEAELVGLRASEKQLKGQLEDSKVTVDEREQRMRDDNRSLDEKFQKADLQAKESELVIHKLEQENSDLRGNLTSMQEKLCNKGQQIADLEKSLSVSRNNEANLTSQLNERESQLEDRERLCEDLQERVSELEARERELAQGKLEAEQVIVKHNDMMENLEVQRKAVEKAQLETSACHTKESQERALKISLLEKQLEQKVKEVSRLQEEVVKLKTNLQSAVGDKVTIQSRLETTEAFKIELQTLTEQLKKQFEEQNRDHVNELLQSKQFVQQISSKLEAERIARTKVTADFATALEEVAELKAHNERLGLENAETREGFHRANTEMAELGMTICKLTAEREETQKHWASVANQVKQLEEQGERETERLNASVAAFRQENASLLEELKQMEKLPETVVEVKELLDKAENEREALHEEAAALRFQMSTENMTHTNQTKSLNEELESLNAQLKSEREKISSLESKVSKLEEVNSKCSRMMGEKDSHITKTESLIRSGEDEIHLLKEKVTSVEETWGVTQQECDELKEKLKKVQADAQVQQQRMAIEIEDLNYTKSTLEERLIELIRDKDVLWQRTDALEFEQKLRAEEQWWLVDREATHCLGCQSQFTWLLRKHHCRLCGRIFCYYCSNNFVVTKYGTKKERCCRECYTQHSAVSERITRSELSNSTETQPTATHTASATPPPYKPTPNVTVTRSDVKQEDGSFDIITEEEVNELYDSDCLLQNTADSQEGEAEDQTTREVGVSDAAAAEEQEEIPPAVQDAEINLLKSRELTSSVLLNIDELSQLGDASRELFVKSGCYGVISVTVEKQDHTFSWAFSSEPKSINFSVVYKESINTPIDQAKVIIPLTRCNAHKETFKGKVKASNPGVYTFIFDNSFSRFLSKKVSYHLTTERPVIYDGSDCP